MSLFVCSVCSHVENSNLVKLERGDESYPNLSFTNMSMQGELLCSLCNTGKWHDEISRREATEIEIAMGEALSGEIKGVFTFHPLWREYVEHPEMFSIDTFTTMEEVFVKEERKVSDVSKTDSLVEDRQRIKFIWCGTPYVREEPKIGRNSICLCGSGKKYKRYCYKNVDG